MTEWGRGDRSSGLESVPDEVLVEEVRRGGRDAGLVLWRRHAAGCRTALGSVLDDPREVDMSLRQSFARVLGEIADGADPLARFVVYLRTSVLLDACVTRLDHAAVPPIVRAFSRLHRLDQALLWTSLVDGATGVDVARPAPTPPAEAVDRLSAAEERLWNGWIDELLTAPGAGLTCSWIIRTVGVPGRGTLGQVASVRFHRHLKICLQCCEYLEGKDRFPLNLLDSLLTRPR